MVDFQNMHNKLKYALFGIEGIDNSEQVALGLFDGDYKELPKIERFLSMHEAGILRRDQIAARLDWTPEHAAEIENRARAIIYSESLWTGWLRTSDLVLPKEHFVTAADYAPPLAPCPNPM